MVGTLRIGAVVAIALLATGCMKSIAVHRGYMTNEVMLQSVQPGVDNRLSVERTLGQPSFVSQFGPPVWYYIASTTEQAPFTRPKISEHGVLAVHFDPAGNVTSIERSGIDQVAYFDPDGEETPTLGRDRGFLEDLFGNIGQVGTGAAGQ